MSGASETAASGLITGFEAQIFLWVWCGVALLYAIIRSLTRPEPDPIRESGPID